MFIIIRYLEKTKKAAAVALPTQVWRPRSFLTFPKSSQLRLVGVIDHRGALKPAQGRIWIVPQVDIEAELGDTEISVVDPLFTFGTNPSNHHRARETSSEQPARHREGGSSEVGLRRRRGGWVHRGVRHHGGDVSTRTEEWSRLPELHLIGAEVKGQSGGQTVAMSGC